MITRIKKMSNIGIFQNYISRDVNVEKDFGSKNFIYGLNTYGKTTLCDIFKDLSEGSNERILKRLTIPDGGTQEIIFGLSERKGVTKYSSNIWNNNIHKNKILIFDSEFVSKNIFNGTNLIEDRETKENFTSFILGDEGVALAKEIEILKKELKNDKDRINNSVPNSKKGATDAQIKKYCNLKISESLEELENQKDTIVNLYKENQNRQKNIKQIESYKIIVEPTHKIDELINEIEKVKEIVQSHYTLKVETLVKIDQHLKNTCGGKKGAQEWISKGFEFMENKDTCPFCGQFVKDKSLLEAFSEYLSDEYKEFKNDLKRKIDSVSINWNIFTLSNDIVNLQKNIKKAEEIFGDSICKWNDELENIYDEVINQESLYREEFNEFQDKIKNLLNSKIALASVAISLESSDKIIYEIKDFYETKIKAIITIVKEINDIIIKTKETNQNKEYQTKTEDYLSKIENLNNKINRLKEESVCVSWLKQYRNYTEKANSIKEKSTELEINQTTYLNTYFNKIDDMFKSYGGHKFKIKRGQFNNKGYRKVFGVNIEFNGVEVLDNELSKYLFSESDKRALALAVYMAKLECMTLEEKSQLILVFDDPVTSFDDNRMKNVLGSILMESDNVQQLFILSHNFTFSKKLSDAYGKDFNFYKLDRINGSSNGLFDLNPLEVFTDEFHINYLKIIKFNSGESNELTENDLRIFLEEFLKVIFAKQYNDNNMSSLVLKNCIDKLKELNLITSNVHTKLQYYRNELNSDSHSFQSGTIEDKRNFSIDFINYLFNNVHMGV